MDLHYVLKKPHITEKVTQLKEDVNRYCFSVATESTKIDVKRAVEELFKVKVDNVRTISVHGKAKKNPRSKRPSPAKGWKKAIVTLKKGNKIELFEGV